MQEEIPAERARAFALAVSDVGCWVLAVLTRNPHAARALVELANAFATRGDWYHAGESTPFDATSEETIAK